MSKEGGDKGRRFSAAMKIPVSSVAPEVEHGSEGFVECGSPKKESFVPAPPDPLSTESDISSAGNDQLGSPPSSGNDQSGSPSSLGMFPFSPLPSPSSSPKGPGSINLSNSPGKSGGGNIK